MTTDTDTTSAAVPAGGAGVAGVLVAALEATWTAIRTHHPDVPAVVVTLGSGTIGTRRAATTLGHFAATRWHVSLTHDGGLGHAVVILEGSTHHL